MPRPRGNKKEKMSFPPLPTTSISSSLMANNGSISDETNCLKNTISSKLIRSKKTDPNNLTDENFLLNGVSYEPNSTRVVVNPAVLRYLEHNRHSNNNKLTIDDDDDDNYLFSPLLSSNPFEFCSTETELNCKKARLDETLQLNRSNDNELFWNFSYCSTDFLPSAQLAEWILTNPHRAQFQSLLGSDSNVVDDEKKSNH